MGGQLDSELTECAATPFATINGTGSRIFCRDVRVTSELRPRTTGCLWKRFSIVIAPACLGAPCRNVLATRSRFTRDFRAGRRVAYGKRCSRCWLTAPSYVRTSTVPAPKKRRRRPGDRAQQGRIEHQNSCLGRCTWQSAGVPTDCRAGSRSGRCRRATASDAGRYLVGRQGFRCRSACHRASARSRKKARNPAHAQSKGPTLLRQGNVQGAAPHGKLLLQTQTVPSHRHPL